MSKNLTDNMSKMHISDKDTVKASSNRRLSTGNDPAAKKAADSLEVPRQARRRLSVTGGDGQDVRLLDGLSPKASDTKMNQHTFKAKEKHKIFSTFAAMSKVGYVPFNPNKVNQDRACNVTNYGGDESKAFFGVYDGHGSLGHEVSQYVSTKLPKMLLNQPNFKTDIKAAITKAHIQCNTQLTKSNIDCTFSGTTAISCYINGKTMYSCNAGDSRAVLAREENGKMKAVPLSNDHKPERKDEYNRIIACKGRVEACKGLKGEDIGPARVWLMSQDVPGLAMTRSFGDLIAASVGVIAEPEIWETTLQSNDRFMILASDGVWEFISNQEAVDLIAKIKDPEAACRVLLEESTRRWQHEEEVIDDITALVVYF